MFKYAKFVKKNRVTQLIVLEENWEPQRGGVAPGCPGFVIVAQSLRQKGSTGNNVDFVKWRVLHPFLDSFSPQPRELEFPFSASKSSIRSWILLFFLSFLFFPSLIESFAIPQGAPWKWEESHRETRARELHTHMSCADTWLKFPTLWRKPLIKPKEPVAILPSCSASNSYAFQIHADSRVFVCLKWISNTTLRSVICYMWSNNFHRNGHHQSCFRQEKLMITP